MGVGIGVYVKGSKEAVKLYMDVFGLELGYHVLNDDGSYYHSELHKDGNPFLSVVEKSDMKGKQDTLAQLGVELESADEVRRAYDLLREGGSIDVPIGPLPWSDCAASVKDRFGVWWYIATGSHVPDDDFDRTI